MTDPFFRWGHEEGPPFTMIERRALKRGFATVKYAIARGLASASRFGRRRHCHTMGQGFIYAFPPWISAETEIATMAAQITALVTAVKGIMSRLFPLLLTMISVFCKTAMD